MEEYAKARVLIVDDEPNNLQLMKSVLQDFCALAFAVNGDQALEAASKLLPDCILLDIMMPGMDGYETCARLKADPAIKDIPVIFITAKSDAEDETRGFEFGAMDYITKPIHPQVVKARLKTHLELKLAREKIQKQNQVLETQNKELIEAARLREDVDRIIRHDLKTPLNGIISLPRLMLSDDDFPSQYKGYMQLLESAGLDMLNMINLSLDMFKMERGIYKIRLETVNVLDILDRILTENQNLFLAKNLSTDIRINSEPREKNDCYNISAENLLCYSMLANLIKNSAEASPAGEWIIIDINKKNGADTIRIFNKSAVPLEIRNKFFDKYATSGKSSGTGLGTYSAKLIAETHGGSIQMETADGEGTVVTVRLPEKKALSARRQKEEKSNNNTSPLSKARSFNSLRNPARENSP